LWIDPAVPTTAPAAPHRRWAGDALPVKGRKGYQGRVERSHRTDDEEFFLPCLGRMKTVEECTRDEHGL